jgi:hypothetical protein
MSCLSLPGTIGSFCSLSNTAMVPWVKITGFGFPVEPEECNTIIGLIIASDQFSE